MISITVKAKMIHHTVRKIQNCSARSFIHTARFHSDTAVFADVNKSYAVASADFIQFRKERKGIHFLAVQAYRNAFFKVDCYIFAFSRSFFRHDSIF